VRTEIVSVITAISDTTREMQQLLKRIALYQLQIEKQSQEVKDMRASL
jgi:K+/H+ antiporter YhaU regulatory subunit KhtT